MKLSQLTVQAKLGGKSSLTMSKQMSENVAKSPCTEYLKIGPHHNTRAAFDNCRQMCQQQHHSIYSCR